MGVIKRGLLGGVSGKVANVVGGSWKGIAYVRALPLSVANPDTEKQKQQRGAFANVLLVAQACAGNIIKPFWNQYAQRMSGFNLFQKTNIKAFDKDGLSDADKFTVTTGDLTSATPAKDTWNNSTKELSISWVDNSGEGNAVAEDKAIIGVYNDVQKSWTFAVTIAERSTESATIELPDANTAQNVTVFLSFQNSKGRTGKSLFDSFAL